MIMHEIYISSLRCYQPNYSLLPNSLTRKFDAAKKFQKNEISSECIYNSTCENKRKHKTNKNYIPKNEWGNVCNQSNNLNVKLRNVKSE